MNLPKYDELYPEILEILKDEKIHDLSFLRNHVAQNRNLTKEQRKKLLPSKTQTIYNNRFGWALTYLKKAGLIKRPARAKYQIAKNGLDYIQEHGVNIDNDDLEKFESFQEFQNITTKDEVETKPKGTELVTPDDQLNAAFAEIQSQLSEDIMTEIMDMSPQFFEKLVLDLLYKMGYGGMNEKNIIHTDVSHDDGIDGLIKEDELGLEHIYIQAKRWSGTVGQPEIQKFSGALSGQGATKGVFITTSSFSRKATSYANRHQSSKIVLIDGKKLTELMIAYGVGLYTEATYKIQKIDTDYFNEEI